MFNAEVPQEAWRWLGDGGEGRLSAPGPGGGITGAKISDEASVIVCLWALVTANRHHLPSSSLQASWRGSPGLVAVPSIPPLSRTSSRWQCCYLDVCRERSEVVLLWRRVSSSGRVCLWSLGVKSFWAPSFSSARPERRTDGRTDGQSREFAGDVQKYWTFDSLCLDCKFLPFPLFYCIDCIQES